ncbi:MAG: universal stress protein, partial [Nitrospirae bacterium]
MSGSAAFRRIVVAVDASADSLAAVRAAARLAEALSAELHGLFVEDANLVRLARLPFAREVRLSAAPRRLEAAALERELRALAAQARQAFEEEARRCRVAAT